MIDNEKEKEIIDKLFELKSDAWESDGRADDYEKGYWWGVYWTIRQIEWILGLEIKVINR